MSGKVLASNRKAFHDYFVIQQWEAGIMLKGSEIKSLRESQSSLVDSWVKIVNNEAWLIGAYIPEYSQAKDAFSTHIPTRDRKLLLNRSEITRIERELDVSMTVVPINIHLNERNIAKVQIALVKGKKLHDKRQAQKEKDFKRFNDD